jgi:hypothetical protein
MGENRNGIFVRHSCNAHLLALIEKNRFMNANKFKPIKMKKIFQKSSNFIPCF